MYKRQILDCVQDPHNLGAILRPADGAGVDAVIAPRAKSVGIPATVLRVSVGAAEKVPFIPVTNLARPMKPVSYTHLFRMEEILCGRGGAECARLQWMDMRRQGAVEDLAVRCV